MLAMLAKWSQQVHSTTRLEKTHGLECIIMLWLVHVWLQIDDATLCWQLGCYVICDVLSATNACNAIEGWDSLQSGPESAFAFWQSLTGWWWWWQGGWCGSISFWFFAGLISVKVTAWNLLFSLELWQQHTWHWSSLSLSKNQKAFEDT